MIILGICNEPSILEVLRIVVLFINIIKAVVPIILIISIMIKLAGAVTKQSQDEINKVVKSAVPNAIAAVLIFLIPTFVDIVARISFPNSDYSQCISGISKETIQVSYHNRMDELIKIAQEELNYYNYSNAYSYLSNIKDDSKRTEYENKLQEIKEQIDNKKNNSKNPNNPIKPQGNLKIYYLSLGRYDGYLIQGNGTTLFIDGGYESQGKKCVEFMKELGVTKLDAIIGSHLHDNHINAHTIILDNFQVGAAYYPDDPRICKRNKTCSDGVQDERINKMNKKIEEKGVSINVLTPNMNVKIGNLTFDILGPIKLGSSVNNNSLHMILKYGNNRFYFSGDSGTGVFNEIYNSYDHSIFENIDIFKHPHHGQNEVPKNYIEVMKPKYVVVPNTSLHLASSEYKKFNSITYALGGTLTNGKTIITGAGVNLKGYLLAETDGRTLTITDKRE